MLYKTSLFIDFLLDKKTFTETVTSAFSAVATEVENFVRPVFKDSMFWSEKDGVNDTLSSDTTTTAEEEDLITIEYQQLKPDHPSVKASDGKALKIANLCFNTISMIGKIC